MLESKIVHLNEIYNFDSNHFLIKRTVFPLIEKTLLKIIKNCDLFLKKNLNTKIFSSITGLPNETNTADDVCITTTPTLITSMKGMRDSTRNWNVSTANTREKQNKIWNEEQQFKFTKLSFITKKLIEISYN